jgi:hypothetical protein
MTAGDAGCRIKNRVKGKNMPERKGVRFPGVFSLDDMRELCASELLELETLRYRHGYRDGQSGNPQHVFSLNVAGTKGESKRNDGSTGDSNTGASASDAKPDAVELARRAEAYIAEQAKVGVVVTNLDAVQHVYEDAGVPLR